MATATANTPVPRDWPAANPWIWLCGGLALTSWSWLWTLAFGKVASDYRIVVLACGLLLTGAGVWLRWRDRQSVYLLPRHPGIAVVARLLMGILFGALALAITGLFFATLFYSEDVGLRPGPTFLVAISTVPGFFWAAHRTLKRGRERGVLESDEETGLVLLAAVGIVVLGSFTLEIAAAPTEWDTIRLFLRAVSAVALFGSALVVASTRVRRWALSVLIVLHFTAITSACLSPPPAPWIVSQAWVRLFRPYLEFMYLNNAYHFYAPNPGPASYLWFRVIYTAPDQKDYGLWFKVPRLDERGQIDHTMALEYQRYIAMTGPLDGAQPVPPDLVFNVARQEMEVNPFWKNRLNLVPNPERQPKVGEAEIKQLQIPLRPGFLPAQQVYKPTEEALVVLKSYTRFVARKFAKHPDPKNADWAFKSLKVYRVLHYIPPVHWYLNRFSPTDPELYNAYYVGNYDAHGEMIVDQDPFQFWMLPVIRDHTFDPNSTIRDYARFHAGDPNWIRRYDPNLDKTYWTNE